MTWACIVGCMLSTRSGLMGEVRWCWPGAGLGWISCPAIPPALQVVPGLSTLAASGIVAVIMLPLAQIQVGGALMLCRYSRACTLDNDGLPGSPATAECTERPPALQNVHDIGWLALCATGCMAGAVVTTLIKLLAISGDQLEATSLLPPHSTRTIEGLIAVLNLFFAFGGQVLVCWDFCG